MTTANLTLDTHLRYTRYTQWLNGSIAVLATSLGLWILFSPERRVDPQWVFWLIWMMATLHTVEEYIFPGHFVAWFNQNAFGSRDPNAPLSPQRAFQTDAVTGIFIPPILVLAGTYFLPLVFFFVGLLWWNAYFHISETVKTGKYFPGFITSLLLYVPGLSYVVYFYLSRGLVSPWALAVVFALSLGGTALFFKTVRGWLAE